MAPKHHFRQAMSASSLAIVVTLASACRDRVEPATLVETPARQFIFDGVRMEERRGGKLQWSAVARRADGDLESTDAVDIHMTHFDEQSGAPDYHVLSPRGTLDMGGHKATFQNVRVTDPQGGNLTAGNASYDGSAERLDIAGPLEFAAPGIIARAVKGELLLKENRMDIAGPVEGTLVSGAPPRATEPAAKASPGPTPPLP